MWKTSEQTEVNLLRQKVFFPQDRVKLLHILSKGVFSTAKCIVELVVSLRSCVSGSFVIIPNYCVCEGCTNVRTSCAVCHTDKCVALPSVTGCVIRAGERWDFTAGSVPKKQGPYAVLISERRIMFPVI